MKAEVASARFHRNSTSSLKKKKKSFFSCPRRRRHYTYFNRVFMFLLFLFLYNSNPVVASEISICSIEIQEEVHIEQRNLLAKKEEKKVNGCYSFFFFFFFNFFVLIFLQLVDDARFVLFINGT